MKRFALVLWLLAPIAVVASIYPFIDLDGGTPTPPPPPATTTPTVAPADGARTEAVSLEAGALAEPVQPESLEQGFIIVVKDETDIASPDSPIYLASNHVGWSPNDASTILSPRSDMRWQIVLDKPKSDARMAFKFTRGSWETVEVADDLSDIDNRMLPLVDASKLREGEKPVIELTIKRWADEREGNVSLSGLDPYREITVSGGHLRRLETSGGGVAMMRDLLVWLPSGYFSPANADRTYPVLYLQDGQNLFEEHALAPGEWRVDEIATELIGAREIEPMIIVGIPHAGDRRAWEYLPLAAADGVEPRADAYVDYVVSEVMPRVERAFRVKTGAEHTGIGGASYGAVVSMHAVNRYPDKFGKLLAFSPAVLGKNGMLLEHFLAQGDGSWPAKAALGVASHEEGMDASAAPKNRAWLDATDALARHLTSSNAETHARTAGGHVHNEDAWAELLADALRHLYPAK